MIHTQLEEKLHKARRTLKAATRENIVELCKRYLTLLAEYRSQLYELKGTFDDHQQPEPSLSAEKAVKMTKSIRAAIENTTQERNRTEMLLLSFTTVSGYEAVEVFNRRRYEGHGDWVLRAGGLRSAGSSAADVMTIQEAVDIAGMLRREEYVSRNAALAPREARI
jgi:hypothetical protein